MSYHYTSKCTYYYDATLTQDLLTKYINTLSSSTATKTDTTYLGNIATMSRFTGSRHEPNPDITSGESEEQQPSIVEHDYVNFVNATGVNFDQARSAAVAAGLSANTIPNAINLNDSGLQATNITFANGGYAGAHASNTTLSNLTFLGSGGIVEVGGGFVNDANDNPIYVGGQALNGLTAEEDLDLVVLYPPSKQAATSAVTATNITVSRNLRQLVVAAVDRYSYYGQNADSNFPGTGVEASKITVHGALEYVYIGNGARVDSLTVGDWKQWGDGEASAFIYVSGGSVSHFSATYMNVYSGGTATNINLGFGGEVTVMGPEDRVSSSWNATTQQWEVTTSYASGAGGVLTDFKMATSGGIQFTGTSASELNQKLWDKPTNGYGNRPYMNGYLAGAPQSAYIEFQSNTSGRNIEIGNGGSMRISSGASVTNLSMTALNNASVWVANSSGGSDMWIGDRGAKLVIDGGFASNVTVEGANMTFDYYSAAYDYFWLYSSAISSSMQAAYFSANGEYASGSAWDQQVYNSASAGYRQYMSSCFVSGGHYTNLGDDTDGYDHKYVGGEVVVGGGGMALNVSGFAYLGASYSPTLTFSSGSVQMTTMAGEVVSNASGALSATVDVGGGAHLSSVTVAGGRVLMGGESGGVARWTGQSNAQSNYAWVENLNLRTSGLVGSNNSAMIVFGGHNYSNTHAEPVMSNGSQVYDSNGYGQWTYYKYDCMDPGEIQYASGDSGLTVQGTYGRFTYTGTGAVTFGGLGTIWNEQAGDRHYSSSGYYSSSADGTSKYVSQITRWLNPSSTHYEFGVVKGVIDENTGKVQRIYEMNGDGGFDWLGTLAVGSGAVVQDVGSQSGLKTANTLTSDSWNPVIEEDVSKKLVVLAGGSADNVTVNGKVTNYERTSQSLYQSNAALVVSSGGTATNISVLSNGIAMAVGGTINGAFVGSGGILYLSGWAGAIQVSEDGGTTIAGPQYLDTGVLNNVHLDKGGQLAGIYEYQFGGKAPSIIANAGAGVLNGITANGVAYMSGVDFAGAVTLAGGQKAVDVTVRGFETITATDENGNPTAWTTTIAYMNVSSGGIVSGATVGEEGAIYVSDGADVSDLVASGGRLVFANSSGWSDYFPGSAAVAGITVRDGGILQVNSMFALTTMDMKIMESAGLEVVIVKDADEKYAKTELNGTWTASWGSGTFRTQDGVLSGFGGQFGYKYLDPIYSSSYTSARMSMTLLNGATLLGADLRGYGYFTVKDGAKVLNTKIKGITANISSSGYASGLSAMTDPTGSAYDTNIYVYGSSALAEQTVLSGGYLGVENGGTVNGVTMLAPEGYSGHPGEATSVGPVELEIMAGGTASNVYASAGVVTLYEGSSKEQGMGPATLSNADVHSSAMLLVNADGVVLDGTLNLGGTVVTTATRYEYVEVEVTDPDSGDTYTDWQRVEKNNAVANATTLTVNFDLTERDGTETVAMIDNLANLEGVTLGTITVAGDQASGSYILAQGAESFTGSLTVTCEGKDDLSVTVGAPDVSNGSSAYSLAIENTQLILTVTVTDITAPDAPSVVADITVPTRGRVTITATFSDDSAVKEYSLDEDTWTEYTAPIVMEDNGTVSFRATDEAGNVSDITTYEVTNIDKVAPEAPSAVADVTDPTNGDVTVTATFCDDTAVKEYSLDGGTAWSAYTDPVVLSDNGAVAFRGTDEAGNVSEITTYEVTNIDKTAPEAPSAVADVTDLTNGDVTVTATFSADSETKEYSINGLPWTEYTAPVVMEDNGNIMFRSIDAAGNVSDITTYEVTNIDKVAPEAPSAVADVTGPTNGDVTVTATFSDDSVVKEYSLDEDTWTEYTDPVVLAENGAVSFRGTDAAGNVSDITTYQVTNIDKVAPEKPVAVANITEPTNQDVTVTATFSDDSVVKEYSTNNKTWKTYTSGVKLTKNGKVYFRGTDAAGNVSDITTYEVTNIDKVAPEAPSAVADITGPTNGDVTITATFSADTAVKEYSLDGQTWSAYTDPVALSGNGAVSFRGTDAAGNVSEVTTYEVANIDKTAPEAPSAVADVTDPTNGDVTVTATFSDDSAVKEYSLDGQTWNAYAEPVVLSDNGTVAFRGTDAAGNVSDVTTYEVANIDKTAPEAPSAVADVTGPTNGDVTITATFSGDTAVKEYSLDGQTWSAYTEPVALSDNGAVSFRGTDAAGNVSDVTTYEVANIDKTAPEAPSAVADVTGPTNGNVTVTATFSDDTAVKEYSLDGQTWSAYAEPVVLSDNGTVAFRGTDAAGNVSDVTSYEVTNIDKTAPEAPSAVADVTGPTNGDVTVTATFSADSETKEYSINGMPWTEYTAPVVVEDNGTIMFRSIDAAGNISEITDFEVANIDKEAPAAPTFERELDADTGEVVVTATWDATDAQCLYSLDGQAWQQYTASLRFSQDSQVQFRTVDAAGNTSEIAECNVKLTVASDDIVVEPTGDGQAVVSWPSDDLGDWSDGYDVQLTVGDTGTLTLNEVSGQGVELCNAPADSVNITVKPQETTEWPEDGETTIDLEPVTGDGPQVVTAETNDLTDVMFGRVTGVWNANYRAGHVSLPGEKAKLKGKNQIGDLFLGSDDASILLLTDDANGDVFFLDDIYSAFPEGIDAQARLAKIDEIQAGAGADVVDLTSTRFEYVGGGLTVHGGAGDDVIWANSGNNLLFGDGGNDRIVGAAGNDVIAGGAGDDAMHGLGGDDLFVFGGNWGNDTVEQLTDGQVTLWFADGDASKWDASTLTYSDGANSVQVTGVSDVTLKFGDDGSQQYQDLLAAGAFADSTSENIFTDKDKNRGMLA